MEQTPSNILTPDFRPGSKTSQGFLSAPEEEDNVALFFSGLVEGLTHRDHEKEREAAAAPVLSIVAPSDPLDRLHLSLEECLSIIPPGSTLGDFDD